MAAWGVLARNGLLRLADGALTARPLRWLWYGPSGEEIIGVLGDFRPADHQTVLEMMAGRYLLASHLVDTHGASPFSITHALAGWSEELRGFSWLRHFRAAADAGERSFARTLVLDWIAREGRIGRRSWTPRLTAWRVLNWLRHYNLLTEGATPDQARAISRALLTQIQSLKVRAGLVRDPVERVLVAIALAAAAFCDNRSDTEPGPRMRRLQGLLEQAVDADGLNRTRSARVQLELLLELETLRQVLVHDRQDHAEAFEALVEDMHRALDAVSLSTGEPAFFHGTGQLPHDLVVALQAQSTARFRTTGTAGGYGRLVGGRSVVVADSGQVPPPAFAGELYASALAFEFSHGAELVVGNCGPAPIELAAEGAVFRQGVAHSTITIDGTSALRIPRRGPFAGRVAGVGGTVEADPDDGHLVLGTGGYRRRYGATIERHLTLMSEGKTLVGQDRITLKRPRPDSLAIARFHLAVGATIERQQKDLLHLRLASGAGWTFLWEGADMRIDESVRHSSLFGFHRIKQIVLEAPLDADREIAWIFTLDETRPGKGRRG
ncbi:MAG TPA: heparinase II/III family protein [Devosia sp.]|nr:heparinase II/III family protein [Devosia sp.]